MHVLRGERRRTFDQWWEKTKHNAKIPDDPKEVMMMPVGEMMLVCLRAYEEGRHDESRDWSDISYEMRTTGRVRRASEINQGEQDERSFGDDRSTADGRHAES